MTAGNGFAQVVDGDTIVVPPRPDRPSVARSAFTRDGDIGVVDRTYAAFEPVGLPIGPFDLFPALQIAPEFTSNIFENNASQHSAVFFVERPEAALRTRGGPVDVDLFARGRFAQVVNYTTENTAEGLGGVDLGSDLGPLTRVTVGSSYGARVLPRYAADSPINTLRPLRYDELDAFATGSGETGRFRLIVRADYARLRFGEAVDTSGAPLLTNDRDRSVASGIARIEYAVKPNASIYVAATGNLIDYRLEPQPAVTRNSTGWGTYVGTSFEITRLIRADARIGYIQQNFKYSGYPAVSGLGLHGSVQFFPTRLWTFTVLGDRSVQDSGVPGSAGLIHTGGEIHADNELRRYLVLSAIGGYYEDAYRGIERHDRDAFAGLSATYLSNDHWNAKAGYQYTARHCTCTGGVAPFDDHRLTASLTFQI